VSGREAGLRCAAIAALVLIADQLSKRLIRDAYAVGSVHHVLPGLRFVRATNTGVAFSIDVGGEWSVLAIAAIVIGGVLAYFARHRERRGLWLATGLVVGGALGNLLDRLRDGAVTDFIKLPLWPAFNGADSAITIGVIALAVSVSSGGVDRRS
jgi:signal peptidase II